LERVAYTLQWIRKPEDYDAELLTFQAIQNAGLDLSAKMVHLVLNVDALFQGDRVSLPSTAILDYVYGVAAYRAWGSKQSSGFNFMKTYHEQHYAHIPPPPSPAPPDDYRDTPARKSGLEESMDELNTFLMYIQGITPEMAAKKREQEEQAAQEVGRSKVKEWRDHIDIY
jgi:hypothetical protein